MSESVHAADRQVLALPPADLLLVGGDARQVLRDGRNAYGFPAFDLAPTVRGSSCTATPPDAVALADVATWADAMAARIDASGGLPEAAALHADVARPLAEHLGLGADDDRVVLCASGTDAESIAAAIVLAGSTRPVRNIVLGTMEAGSGTKTAAIGRFFSERAPFRATVEAGAPIDGFDIERVRLVDVELRDARGRARRPFDVEAEVEAHIEDAIECGETVLVHVMAGSKTDLRYLSPDWVRVWRSRGGDQLRCIVDAAQLRVSTAELREYLAAGASIVVTGSKAVGAPPFCGALVLDDSLLDDARRAVANDVALPEGFSALMARADLPAELEPLLPAAEPANLGVLARWHVALEEMRRFAAVPELWREAFTHALRVDIAAGLQRVPGLVVVDSESPTIVAFGLRGADGSLVDKRVLRGFYDAVVAQPGVQIGQPVELPDGRALARFAIGHVTVTRAADDESAARAAADATERALDAFRSALRDFVLS